MVFGKGVGIGDGVETVFEDGSSHGESTVLNDIHNGGVRSFGDVELAQRSFFRWGELEDFAEIETDCW